MFIKPYSIKSNSPLKGSDAKKLRQRIEKAFPNATTDQLQLIIPPKANISQLKLTTHSEFQTLIYCVDKLPMFFEIEDGVLAPSLYALWQVPTLLPYFTTFGAVLPKLCNGADLMLPGVVPQGVGMNIYGRFKKSQLVAVNLTSNKSAVGVGILPRSSDDLYMCGGRGSAVKMLHLFGDKLWGHEPQLTQQVPIQKNEALTKDDFPALGEKIQRKVVLSETLPTVPMNEVAEVLREPDSDNEASDSVQIETTINSTEASNGETQTETSEKQLRTAFLSALKNHGKSLQLPLLTSNFYRLYMVPEASQPLDLKKTRYKKLSNFLSEMVDCGFIVVREETKGVDKIISIDHDHPELVNLITDYKQPTASDESEALLRSELTELLIVTDATAAFFTKMNYKRGEGIPPVLVRKIIREYISKEKLTIANPLTKHLQLDTTLQQICNCTTLPLDKIVTEITNQMEHRYEMCSVKMETCTNKPFIQMSLATRSGNKKVTLVSNVQCYGIIVSEFIKLCKQGAAASTTIIKLPHQKSEQLQIQGNQVRFVFNLLTETYKVPAKCILGLELAKDGRKHKKK